MVRKNDIRNPNDKIDSRAMNCLGVLIETTASSKPITSIGTV